jgi:hypothetical protein
MPLDDVPIRAPDQPGQHMAETGRTYATGRKLHMTGGDRVAFDAHSSTILQD